MAPTHGIAVTTTEEDRHPQQQQPQLPLLPELWHTVLTYLRPYDLCQVALVNHELYELSSKDLVWEPHFQNVLAGKQNVHRFVVSSKGLNGLSSIKERLQCSLYDSKRPLITPAEIVYFTWKLYYNGEPSQMGLRNFNADGTYNSPYSGLCEWTLQDNHLVFMGVVLPVVRNPHNWGWIIGSGCRTVYYSIEPSPSSSSSSFSSSSSGTAVQQ